MTKYLILAIVFLSAGTALGGQAGYKAGSYMTGEKMEKQAIAHQCGQLDPRTLSFSWSVQPEVQLVADALPPVVPSRKR